MKTELIFLIVITVAIQFGYSEKCCGDQGGTLGTGQTWKVFDFDKPNFMCYNWDVSHISDTNISRSSRLRLFVTLIEILQQYNGGNRMFVVKFVLY